MRELTTTCYVSCKEKREIITNHLFIQRRHRKDETEIRNRLPTGDRCKQDRKARRKRMS